jgi:ComF family protein
MSIIDLFFPRGVKCVFCGRETEEFGICNNCIDKIEFVEEPCCIRCGGKVKGKTKVCIECKGRDFEFERNYSVLIYDGDVRDKIIAFKQSGHKYIGEAFSWLIERKFKDLGLMDKIDFIIPMPINDRRRKERGFNQSEVLCKELLETGKVDMTILTRIKDTPHQTGLSRENRENNLRGCFKVADKKKIKGKVVLVVDDIYTTGSTFNECARTLKKAGASQVFTMSLARAPIKKDNIIVSLAPR